MAAFESFGYEVVRQRGSHIRLRDPSGRRQPLTIPDHRELKKACWGGSSETPGSRSTTSWRRF